MNDCPNADIRDQLPDLLHERLDVSMRAAVMAHVDSCADCRAELDLLRGVHGMLVSRTPRVDVNYIVNALPKRAARPVRLAPRRHVWGDWRIAAAVTVLAVGGGSFALLRQGTTPMPSDSVVAQAPTARHANAPSRDSSAPTLPAVGAADVNVSSAEDQAGLATSAHLADLNERELQALLDQIDQLQAVPMTESEPVTVHVDSKRLSPEGA